MQTFFRDLSTKVNNTRNIMLYLYGMILIYIFAKVQLRNFSQVKDGGHPWQTGDWLINYQSGFVRRGLLGELILNLSRFTGLDILWLTFSIQVFIFFIMLFYHFHIVRCALHSEQNLEFRKLSILLLSPAGVLFCLYELDFSLRKEVIGLALINWMYFYRLSARSISKKYVVISLSIYTIFIFSWEAGIAFLPFIFTLLIDDKKVGRNFRFSDLQKFRIILLTAISFLCFFVSIIFHGTIQRSERICSSILQQENLDQNLCSGAVDAMGWSFSYFWAGSTIGSPLRLIGFLLLLLISSIPFLQFPFIHRHKWLVIQFGLGFCFFNILAADTGRLIYVLSMICTNQVLYDLRTNKVEVTLQEKRSRGTNTGKIIKLLLVIIYISCWTLPASGSPWRLFRF